MTTLAGPLSGSSRRAVWRRGVARKAVAAALLGGAVYAATTALAPPAPDPGTAVLITRQDLSVGDPFDEAAVESVHLPEDLVPAGAVTDHTALQDQVAASPVRAGEVVTDVRVGVGAPLTGLDPGLILAHLPPVDSGLVATLTPGTRIDVLGTLDGRMLAGDVLVVQRLPSAPGIVPGDGARPGGGGVLVAVTPAQAAELAGAVGGDLPGTGFVVTVR